MASSRQIEFIMSLQAQLDLSDKELVDKAREHGIVVRLEGQSAVLGKLGGREASELIDVLLAETEGR